MTNHYLKCYNENIYEKRTVDECKPYRKRDLEILAERTKSCDCMRIEKTFVEDTSLNIIRSKVRSNNTSGVKGVAWY